MTFGQGGEKWEGSDKREQILTARMLADFRRYLIDGEKGRATVEKYMHDIWEFSRTAAGRPVTKEMVLAYKQQLVQRGCQVSTVNAKLCGVNGLLKFLGWQSCCVKALRRQRRTYRSQERALTKAEYLKLLTAAKCRPRLYLVLKTICGTGIRVSELQFFTVEAVKRGGVDITCKGKTRTILLPAKLRKQLAAYCRRQGIHSGTVFCTKNGKPLDRSYIWAQMKKLCGRAGVAASKVFPHNLRKLFAVTFYRQEKDVARLADVLGHSSIDTTRIYIMETEQELRQKIDRLGLVI